MDRIGRYEIIRELGRGAMGVVYRARDPKIGRDVAIKTIRLADKADPSEIKSLRDRLFREAQSAGRLSHPGIVTVYDVDEEDGIAYIAMELVEGRTLDQLLSDGHFENFERAADILKQAAAALDYAHGKEIIHRDVKPGNLILSESDGPGPVKIMDFGIARIASSNLTQPGTVMGTPSYMSPEQVQGREIDGRSDQFSLGVIAYEMITGRKPFQADNVTSLIFKIVAEPPQRPAENRPWVSEALDAVVMRALAKSPEDRFPDCAAFAEGFAQAVAGAPAEVAAGEPVAQAVEAAALPEISPFDATLVDATAPLEPVLPPLQGHKAVSTQTDKEPKRGIAKTLLAATAAILVVAFGALAVTNPAALSDPSGAIQATFATWFPAPPEPELAQPEPAPEPVIEPLPEPASVVESAPPVEPPAETPAPAPTESSKPKPEPKAAQKASPPPAETAEARREPTQTAPPKQTAPPPEPEPKPVEPEPVAEVKSEPKAAPKQAVRRPTPAPSATANATVSVYFRSNPVGAEIIIDNNLQWKCKTPCRINDLPAGAHNVIAKMAGYHTASRRLDLGDKSQEVFQVNLEDARVTIIITSEPAGGEIFIDGHSIGQRTPAKVPLPAGTYQIKVSREGVGSAEQVVLVDRDRLPYAKFILQK